MRYLKALLIIVVVAASWWWGFGASAPHVAAIASNPSLKTLATLEHPWGMDFLPDGRLIITERAGRLRVLTPEGKLSEPISGVPETQQGGQGGLLDVAVDPDFVANKLIYISYSEPEGDKAGTAVARAVLSGNALEKLEVIFRQQPKTKGYNHFGSRLVFVPDGHLFITLGERFDYAALAQKLDNHLGKLIRIRPDGSVPADNPFANTPGALPEIWSYGHRNIQGAAINPKTGALWIHEHGPKGGDEINIPQAGKNYGWPEASYGSHYTSEPIPDEHSGRGFEEPIYHWTPSIAPSGMAFYNNPLYPAWNGTLLVGALAASELTRLTLDGDKVIKEEKLLKDLGARIRDVAVAKDGSIYLLVDADEGQVLRMKPQ